MAGINELRQKVESDAAFKESLQKSADAEDLLNKIKEAGFDVTPEELVNTVQSGENGEVSDDNLEAVAGGATIFAKTYFVTSSTIFAKTYFVEN